MMEEAENVYEVGSSNAPVSSNLVAGVSMSNDSNTSLTSIATTSSRGNVSQSGNQTLNTSSQRIYHQTSSSQQNQQQLQQQQQQNPNFDSNVISERVKNLATQIYQELKRIISRCNYDEDILSGLMPLIVRVLESLDLALIENQQLQVELELCKDDNSQLVIMFEKEKAAKRAIDKKLIESEYAYEEERQQYQQKIESLDNIVKLYELKAKNASDQASRFEEKEAERKKEYNKLHDRYTELLKSHCDVIERVRHLVGKDEAASLSCVNAPRQMVASSSDLAHTDLIGQQIVRSKLKNDETDFDRASSLLKTARDTSKAWNVDTELTLEDASLVVIEDNADANKTGDGSSHHDSDKATSDPEGEHEKESENDSIAYTSMEKEFRKLIQENKDLLNTKNALNVVKDDLIAEVDRLTNEVTMYEQSFEQLNLAKDQMKQKVAALDAELRKTKEELEKAKQKIRENNEEGVPYSQRKRFGRAEMAKVLMERNNYKEKFMELQDAVRYTELVRANKVETEKRSGLWKFFSNLFGAPPRDLSVGGTGAPILLSSSQNSSPVSPLASPAGAMISGDGTNQSGPDVLSSARNASILSTNQRLTNNSDLIVLMDSDVNVDRSRAFRIGAGVGRLSSDTSSYVHAYGWILPTSSVKALSDEPTATGVISESSAIHGGTSSHVAADILNTSTHNRSIASVQDDSVSFASKMPGLQVPIPQYCRPLIGDSLGMKIWCAAAIDLSGGDQVNDKKMDLNSDSEQLSTFVWICGTQHSRSKITIIDIKTKPNELLDSFYVPTFLYCIKSIPGCKNNDLLGVTGHNDPEQTDTNTMLDELIDTQKGEFYRIVESESRQPDSKNGRPPIGKDAKSKPTEGETSPESKKASRGQEDEAEISRILDNNVSEGIATLQRLNDFVAHTQKPTSEPAGLKSPDNDEAVVEAQEVGKGPSESGESPPSAKMNDCKDAVYYQPFSTHLPTVWMGGKDSVLYVHSAIGQWKDCIAYVKLRDSILQICHYRGRVFVALADGTLCVFFRNAKTKKWDFDTYLVIDINLLVEATTDSIDLSELITNTSKLSTGTDLNPDTSVAVDASEMDTSTTTARQSAPSTPARTSKWRNKVAGIRCLEMANKNLWVGYRNRVLIIDPFSLKLKHTFSVVPQLDNQIRQIISMHDGVFCCLRSDLILRLYSSLNPYQHIQNIDVEPIVTRLISPKTFVISHITAMMVAKNTLWIGNAHGIILTIPCKLVPQVLEAPETSNLSIARFVPKCDIGNAQVSFHGHRDAVKFFVQAHNLMLSGGQGYLDFRLDMDDQSKAISDKSHLILWRLPTI